MVARGDLWLWTEGEPTSRHVEIGDAAAAWPSPDGRLIALARKAPSEDHPYGVESLWVVAADGGGLRELVSADVLEGDLGDTGAHASVFGVDWIPGTHNLTWRVSPTAVEGLGGPMPTIIRIADADTGEVGELALDVSPMSESMSWSPDGSHAAIVGPSSVRVADRDGDVVSQADTGGAFIGMGHGPYVPFGRWDAAGGRFGLMVPRRPLDVGRDHGDYAFDVLAYASPDLSPVARNVITAPLLTAGGLHLSPDLGKVAYHVQAGNDTTLYIEAVDGSAWRERRPGAELRAWAPDGERYVYERMPGHEIWIAGRCVAPVRVPIGASSEAERTFVWVNHALFAFLERVDAEGDDPWNLRLAGLDGTSRVLATIEQGPEVPVLATNR